MKKTILTLLVLAISGSVMASIRRVPVEESFIPKGFDSNDSVEIVVTGYLPNLCYQSPSATISKQENGNVDIEITAIYNDTMNGVCPEIIVPFDQTIELGVLQAGKYDITVNGKKTKSKDDLVKGTLIVEESTSSYIDENVYAHIDHVKKDYKNREIEIHALNPSDCLVLDRVEFHSNGSNTYSVLPILKQVDSFCPMKMTPMSVRAKVPTSINKGKILLHVRSMEGKSYNTIFSAY